MEHDAKYFLECADLAGKINEMENATALAIMASAISLVSIAESLEKIANKSISGRIVKIQEDK